MESKLIYCCSRPRSKNRDRDFNIVKSYLGIECEPTSYRKVGDIYSLSRERVRQIVALALFFIRKDEELFNETKKLSKRRID